MNSESVVKRVSEPLYTSRKWMRTASVLLMIQGVFSILSLWGIFVCWIPFWMGILLRSAAKHVETAFETDDEAILQTTMEKLAKYFRVFGILAMILVVVFILGFLAAFIIPLLSKAGQISPGTGA